MNEWIRRAKVSRLTNEETKEVPPVVEWKNKKLKRTTKVSFVACYKALIKTSKVAGRQLAVGGPTANHANERVSRARAREIEREREGESHACACSREWRLVLFKEGIIFDAVCIIKSRILRPENAACSISGPSLSYLIAYRDVCYRKAAIHEWNLSPTICQRFERGIVVSSGTICETIAWPGLFCL